jgi:HAD superfamily hydrolase (TIGR01509 family)
MIKAVLFDMDGVLYDSMPSHAQAWQETMASLNVHADLEDFYLLEGRTGVSTINLLFNRAFGREATPDELQLIYDRKTRRFEELEQPESRPMQGALAVLQKVKALGLQRTIVTGSGQATLFEEIEKHYPGFFDKDLMVTAFDVQFGKPHPEPYLMGLKKLRLKPEEALVVENAPLGVESARSAGIFTVAVNTGPLPDKVLWDAGADVLYPNLQALADDFETLLNRHCGLDPQSPRKQKWT